MKGLPMSRGKKPAGLLEEAAVKAESAKCIFTLYVAGMMPKSLRAIENAKSLCEAYLKDRHELEIVDIYQQPELAGDAQVVAAPTLIKSLPPPLQKFIGGLSDPEPILVKLAIQKEQNNRHEKT